MSYHVKQDCITAKDHAPWRFLYLRETKSWWCEGGDDGEGGIEGGEEGGEEKSQYVDPHYRKWCG